MSLYGARVLVTRSREQVGHLAASLEALGATVVALPAVEVGPPEDRTEIDAALAQWSSFAWVVFASVHAVDAVGDRASRVAGPRIAAVGPATAARLEALGVRVDLVPHRAQAAWLATELEETGISGERILLPVSELADERLPAALREAGAVVTVARAYGNRKPQYTAAEIAAALTPQPDLVLFASPSAAGHLVELLAEAGLSGLAKSLRAVTIGPRTTEAVRGLGIAVAAEAAAPSDRGLAAAAEQYWRAKGR